MIKRRGSIKILKHICRGSKLINSDVAFDCASHMFACIVLALEPFSLIPFLYGVC